MAGTSNCQASVVSWLTGFSLNSIYLLFEEFTFSLRIRMFPVKKLKISNAEDQMAMQVKYNE
jgi:hypothetical protein